MAKNNKKGLIFCKLEPPKLELIEPSIKLEPLEPLKIDTPDIKIGDVKIDLGDTSKRTEFAELLESINGLVFGVMDKKIIEEGLRNKKDKETISILKKYDQARKRFYKRIKGGKEIEGK